MSVAAELNPESPAPVRRRWGWWLLLAVLVVVFLLAVFGPALFGRALLARLGGDYAVTAQGVGGPLWSPTVSGLKVSGPGVDVRAGRVVLGLSGVNLFGKSARLDLSLDNADVKLKLKTLLGGQPQGGGGGFTLIPGNIDVQNTRLNIDGTGFDVPSGSWTAQSLKSGGPDNREQDALKISGATTDGPLNVLFRYRTVNGQLQGSADLSADARIINHYWHDKKVGGVTGGQLSGRYSFGSGPVVGDIRLTGTTLAVPGAEFVKVTALNGTATHRGDLISFRLAGTGFDGPLTATGSVDLKAHQWDVKAQASPLFSALGKALGQGGKGVGRVTVHAYGWNTVTVKADVSSPAGEFSVLPYRDLKATYLYRRDKVELNNDLTFSADTLFQGQQRLSGQWTFNRAGVLAWTGNLLGKPLNLNGTISAKNVISAQGQAVGGPLRGSLGLADKAVTLAASPDFYSVSGDVTARGTLDRLNLVLSGGKAGPVDIAGSAVFGREGLNADLGPIQLRLDRQLRGRWQADGLNTAGLLITGAGELKVPEATLTGQLRAAVPLLSGQPSGPIALNWQTRRADWSFSGGNLTWRGDTFALTSSGLSALGYDLRGTLALTTALKASGSLRASNASGTVTATGQGDHLDLKAVQGGVSVTARTQLSTGFPTTARVQGADISGTVTVDQGARFTLRTGNRNAQGRLSAEGWNASGDIDLAALRPLIGGDLDGTARLNLAGQGGTVDFAGSGYGASLNGTLTRSGGILSARTDVKYRIQGSGAQGDVSARLSGRVFPDLNLGGPVTLLGLNVGNQLLPTQTVQAQLSGPYSGIRAAIGGRLTSITAGGLTLPSQPLALQASLTPALKVSGSYGGLKLNSSQGTVFSRGTVQVQGTQLLRGYGESGQVRLNGSYGPDWAGQLTASGTFGPYSAQVSGPWRALNVGLSTQGGLRASGILNAVTQGYDLRVRGPVAGLAGLSGLSGLYVQGTIAGTGAAPRGNLSVTDSSGGSARVALSSLKEFQIQANSFRLAGQKFQGNLSAAGGLLSGTLSAGPLNLTANNGQFRASGTLSGYVLNATGRLALPSTLTGLNLSVTGPLLSVSATGSGTDLRGAVTLKAQQYGTVARLPAQLLPLRASIFPLSADLGGLKYNAGWAGQTRLKYVYGAQAGTLALVGSGPSLSVVPIGPLAGRLQVLPSLSGSLSAPVSPLLTLLPAQFASAITPGRLSARIGPSGTSAVLSLESARYLGQPLGLSAAISWRSGITASGALTHPGSTVPFVYDGQNLTVSGARLDALALKPLLGTLNVTGSIRADLSLPGLGLEKARGNLSLDLRAAGQQARGTLRLAGGTLSADLSSTLGGQTLRLAGPLYPQASAALQYGELRAALNGDLRTQATLNVTGSYSGRSVALSAVGGLNPRQVRLSGAVAGLNVDVRADQKATAGWTLGGTFGAPDLSALLGTAGTVSGTLGGSLNDVRLNAVGRVAGADFTLPARFTGGVLSVQAASAALPGTASARVSGTVYPALKLSGPVTLSDYLPGSYALSAVGSLGKPDLRLSGRTAGAPRGLDAPGSSVSARLFGRDWKVTASGERLSGDARGQFGAGGTSAGNDVPAGLVQARFTVAAPYHTGSQTIRLDGTSGWSQSGGFLGDLRVGGTLSGKSLSARVRGNGDLSAEASLGQLLGTDPERANLSARFPASLPLRPGGSLTLRSLDIGAFWGRPQQLSLSADAALTGRSWAELGATLKGNLTDQAEELSGAISTSLSGGALALNLEGRKLNGSATLKGSEYAAALSSSGASLARLLPASAGVSALTLSGQASLSGSIQTGVREVRASGLDIRGSQSQIGPFNLTGSVLYTPQQTQASLDGTLFGGTLNAAGSLPDGLNVTLNGLKPAALGVDSLDGQLRLSGRVSDPALSGRLNLTRPELIASVDLSGTASDPRLNAAATLRGQYAGRVLAQVSSLKLSPLSADLHVYGAASQGANRVNLDLSGVWPKLAGTATINAGGLKEPVTLVGDGQGNYALKAGALGSGTVKLDGLIPTIAATARLTPLALIGGTGDASADVSLSGPLSALTLTAQASVPQAEVSGVSVAGLALNIAGPLTGPGSGAGALVGTLNQDGQTVGTLASGTLTFNGLKAGGYGLQASASGRATLSGTGSAALKVSGAGVQADLKAAYAGGSVALSGAASASGVQASLNSTGSIKNGWTGTLNLDGGPAGVLTSPGRFTLSGPLLQPLLTGQIGLADAGVKVVANRQNVQLRLADGPGVQASGVLNLDLQKSIWEGQAVYTRPEASLAVKLSGAAGSPQAAVNLTRGSWKASGTLSPRGADLYVSDGSGQTQPAQTQATQPQSTQSQPTQGRIRWDGQTLGVNLPGLLLDTLGVGTLKGRLRATGSVDTRTLDGAVQFALNGLQTGYTVPDLNLPVDGDLSGSVALKAGQVQASASLKSSVGTVDLSLKQPQRGGSYSGSLKARIVQPASAASGPTSVIPVTASEGGTTASATIAAPQVIRAGGTLSADLTLDASGLKGEVVAQSLNLSLGGLDARLNGSVALSGQSFTLQAGASSDMTGDESQVSLSGSGGLADVLPALTPLTGIQPVGNGYSLRAALNGLELSGLKVAPNLSGRVSGEAAVSDGGGTFVLRSNALRLGDTVLSTRIDGTLVGDGSLVGRKDLLSSDWRIRGVVGNNTAAASQLSASLSGGILSGTFQMRGLPLDAFVSAFSGTLPGRGQLTGLARFRLPLSDPLAGEVNVVAERLTVSSTMLATPATPAPVQTPATRTPATQTPATSVAQTPVTQTPVTQTPITQTLAGSGFVRYANRELQNVDLHLSGAGRWDVTGQYTRQNVAVTASFQNTTFTPALLFIPSLREQSPSLQGTLSLSVAGSYERPVGSVSGSNLSGALGSISLSIPSLSGQLPDNGLFSVQAPVQAGGSLGADGNVKVTGRLDNLNLKALSVLYTGVLIPQGLGRIENVQATVSQVGTRQQDEGYTLSAQAVGGLGVGSLNVQGSLSPLYDLKASARNFNLPISVIYGRQSRVNADLSITEQGRAGTDGPILVTGAVNVASLVLGTGGASTAALPAPASAGASAGGGDSSGPGVNYVSPLPDELTTFPRTQQQLAAKKVSPLLSRLTFQNIPISAPGGIRVDESIARAELSGNLVLSGTGSAPKLLGEVKAIRGTVDLRDNSFAIDTGSAVFGGTSLYPVLSVSATGDVPLPPGNQGGGGLVGVNLALDGRFGPQPDGSNALTINTRLSCVRNCTSSAADLSSANPNAEAQLYSLVAVGTPDLASLPSNLGTLGTSALKTALNLFVLGEVQRNIARALGVDVFKINAALPGENGSTGFGATFTVGSYLTRQLYLQYQVDLTGLGLINATYTTPNNLFTLKAGTTIQGLDLNSLNLSFSAAYNFTNRSSVQLGVASSDSTKINFGYVYRW